MRPDDAIELFNRCRGHCIERQNYIEDLQNGSIRRDRNSRVSRSSGFEYSPYMMEPTHTTNNAVHQGPRNNIHWTQGYPTPSRHFHTQTQDLQQSIRKFPQNQTVYQRGHNPPPPAPPREDYSQGNYSWNVQPNASHLAQNQRWCPGSYYGLPYPAYYGWTQ
nr:dual specificity phosphatase 11 [Pipistrellus kuhlii]